MANVDYMDLAVRCSRKAVKLNHSLTLNILHCFKDYKIYIHILNILLELA